MFGVLLKTVGIFRLIFKKIRIFDLLFRKIVVYYAVEYTHIPVNIK